MKYISAKAYAQRQGISARWVHELCKAGKIQGAMRLNGDGVWMIPEETNAHANNDQQASITTPKEVVSMVNAEKQMETGQLLLNQANLEMAVVYFEFAGEEYIRRNDLQNALIAYEKTLYCFETLDNSNRLDEIKTIIKDIKKKMMGE